MFGFLEAGDASQAGVALADGFTRARARERVLDRALREIRGLKLNLFQRARLANAFKWRLREKGIADDRVEQLTHALVLRLSGTSGDAPEPTASAAGEARDAPVLRARGNRLLARGAFGEAVECYQEALRLDPHHAIAHNNLAAALCRLGRYREAQTEFRRAIQLKPSYVDAHANLGNVLGWLGRFAESEAPLRRVLKARPKSAEVQLSLATTLMQLGRLAEATSLLRRTAVVTARSAQALVVLGQIAAIEGRLEEAEENFKAALSRNPASCSAWSGMVRVRRMTPQDGAWLAGAKRAAASAAAAMDEIAIRYAIAKYHDDLGQFDAAFASCARANDLQKALAVPYDREGHAHAVDETIRVYSRERLASAATSAGASDSMRPVFIVGMPRSGTSLVEQIIASHPEAAGGGELEFWADAVARHPQLAREGLPDEARRRRLAAGYLRAHASSPAGALRVVDKATVNTEYLGLIHSVFPRARIVHVRRDPLDTCLSAYFQPFQPTLNFAMDLADLAHCHRQYERLMAHWRAVLPRDSILEVPYEKLVADQEGWTRRLLAFIGLEWHEQTLQFHATRRVVLTASYWQVRQPMYQSSVGRWRHYRSHLGSLLGLRQLPAAARAAGARSA